MQEHSDEAIAVRDALAEAARSLDFAVIALPLRPWPAFAVPMNGRRSPMMDIAFKEHDWCLCSVVDHAPDWVLFTSGVGHSVALSPQVFEAVNSLNRELIAGRYLIVPSASEPNRGSIIYQIGQLREHLGQQSDVKFLLLDTVERSTYGWRTLLVEHSVMGELYELAPPDTERLYFEHGV